MYEKKFEIHFFYILTQSYKTTKYHTCTNDAFLTHQTSLIRLILWEVVP